jgi:hypothetical protein
MIFQNKTRIMTSFKLTSRNEVMGIVDKLQASIVENFPGITEEEINKRLALAKEMLRINNFRNLYELEKKHGHHARQQ